MSFTRSIDVRFIVLVTLIALLAVALFAVAAIVGGDLGGGVNALGELAASSGCGCSGGGLRVICPDVYLCLM